MRDIVAMMDNMNKLPEKSMVLVAGYGIGGLVHKGTAGYTPFPAITTQEEVDKFNERHGVTEAQAMAMEIGSMMGWDVPGANVDKCQEIIDKRNDREAA